VVAIQATWSQPDRLPVVPPDSAHLEVVVPAERAGGGRSDPAVHEYVFEPSGDSVPSGLPRAVTE
jgi:hypothetical protein